MPEAKTTVYTFNPDTGGVIAGAVVTEDAQNVCVLTDEGLRLWPVSKVVPTLSAARDLADKHDADQELFHGDMKAAARERRNQRNAAVIADQQAKLTELQSKLATTEQQLQEAAQARAAAKAASAPITAPTPAA